MGQGEQPEIFDENINDAFDIYFSSISCKIFAKA